MPGTPRPPCSSCSARTRCAWSARSPGDLRPLRQLMPELRRGGVRAVTATGVLGDPRTAGAAAGAALLDRLVADLLDHVARWRCGG